jgi:simple sugar transport system substrate-binding protein/basic membrane protein A
MDRRQFVASLLGSAGVLSVESTSLFAQAKPLKVALLLPGSANDQSFNSYGFAGLNQIKSVLGAEIAYSENVPAAEQVEAMRDYARREFDVVFGHSGRFLDAAKRVAPGFPKTRFIVAAGTEGNGSNVDSVDMARDQFAYVIGVAASRMTKSKKIGVIGGLEGLLALMKTVGGFRKGVKSVAPDVEVRVVWLSSMEDVALAKEAVRSLVQSGSDVILGILNRGHLGIVEAAKESKVLTVGRAPGHTDLAPEYVLTNTVEDWPSIYVESVRLHTQGKLIGTARVFGFDTPGSQGASLVYRGNMPFNPVVPAAVQEEAKRVMADIGSGKIKVDVTKEDARGGI